MRGEGRGEHKTVKGGARGFQLSKKQSGTRGRDGTSKEIREGARCLRVGGCGVSE